VNRRQQREEFFIEFKYEMSRHINTEELQKMQYIEKVKNVNNQKYENHQNSKQLQIGKFSKIINQLKTIT